MDEAGHNTERATMDITKFIIKEGMNTAKDIGSYAISGIYKVLNEKYRNSDLHLELHGEKNLKELINSKSPLKQIDIPLDKIKEIEHEFKINHIPCAIYKTEDKAKFVFFEAHRDLVKDMFERYMEKGNNDINLDLKTDKAEDLEMSNNSNNSELQINKESKEELER